MGERLFDRVLEKCLQEVERTGDVDTVLRRHPEEAEALRPLLQLASSVREEYAEVPEPRAQLADGWARLRREARQARRAAGVEQVAVHSPERRASMRLRLVPTLIGVALVVAVGLAGMVGVVRAAETAVPGEPLYGLERFIENVQCRLTRDPEAAAQLRMQFAEKRMAELGELVRRQDQARLEKALREYGDAVGALPGGPNEREVLGDPARVQEMSRLLARNEEQIGYAFQRAEGQQEEDDGEEPEGEDEGWWTLEDFTHPVAASLAEHYDVDYDDIVYWFQQGYGFGEIMHALETADKIEDEEVDWADLLEEKGEDKGWGDIWQEYGLIGRPEEVGPPDHAGPKDEEKEPGPPSHAGPKDEENEAGPPDHAGPKDKDRDPGPPFGSPPGQMKKGDGGD
ncbi:MAG: DUF5667 domain-containing protein [Chloroflexota bacterium]|nr:DUF5667 domain-containing protein [Chloroflexota bacterium]